MIFIFAHLEDYIEIAFISAAQIIVLSNDEMKNGKNDQAILQFFQKNNSSAERRTSPILAKATIWAALASIKIGLKLIKKPITDSLYISLHQATAEQV